MSSILSPDVRFVYSSIGSDYQIYSNPALLKMTIQGGMRGIYDIVDGYTYGFLHDAEFINDSTLIASAAWGNHSTDFDANSVKIDTLGNLKNFYYYPSANWLGRQCLSQDNKVLHLITSGGYQMYDAHLYKSHRILKMIL